MTNPVLIEARHIAKSYLLPTLFLRKYKDFFTDVDFRIRRGEIVGLAGPSGVGKSTLGRLIIGLDEPSRGEMLIEGIPASRWRKSHPARMSIVMQDYADSANPCWTVRQVIEEPLRILREKPKGRAEELLRAVELPESYADRYPHQLSGGQLQRVCIARALAANPEIVLFDEAVSSLDVPVQAGILRLLKKLHTPDSTWIFISHDLCAIANLCPRILFLGEGKVVEDVETAGSSRVRSRVATQLLRSVLPFETEAKAGKVAPDGTG